MPPRPVRVLPFYRRGSSCDRALAAVAAVAVCTLLMKLIPPIG